MEEDQGTFKYAGPQYVFDIGRSADTAFCMKCALRSCCNDPILWRTELGGLSAAHG